MSEKDKKKGTSGEFGDKTVAINDMSAAKQRRLLQCWLMENLKQVMPHSRASFKNYRNALGDSRKVRNNLISIPGCEGLFELTNRQITSMIPSFTLSRNSKGSSSDFHFDTHIKGIKGLDGILQTRVGRGSNVGFKSFSYEMKGASPATAESLIEAKLVLSFASLSDLYRHRDGNPSFADLLGQPTEFVKGSTCVVGKSEKEKTRNSKYYNISVTLGYHSTSKSIDSKIKSQMAKAFRTFELGLRQHSVSFKQDGSLEVEIEYHSYIDQLLVEADVLSLGLSSVQKTALEAKVRSNCQKKEKLTKIKSRSNPSANCGPNSTPTPTSTEESGEEEDIKDDMEETADAIMADKANAYSRLFDILFEKNLIYTAIVKAEDLVMGSVTPSPPPKGDNKKATDKKAKQAVKKADSSVSENLKSTNERLTKLAKGGKEGIISDGAKKNLQQALEGTDYGTPSLGIKKATTDIGDMNLDAEVPINFFFFGDLLDAAFECLNGPNSKYNDLQIFVGTFPYHDGTHIPLASIPISLKLFQAWWVKHVLMKERSNYPLRTFISDTFSNLVRPALSPKNCYGTRHLIPKLGIETVSHTTASGGKCRISGDSIKSKGGAGVELSQKKIKTPSTSTKGKKSKLPSGMYYLVYATSISDVKKKGDMSKSQKQADSEKGIYWLKAGTKTGLVKKITFKKTDQPGAKEARIEAEGGSTGSTFIDRYNAEVEMFGTSIFKPGMTVFIDPITSSIESERGLALGVGLGGYYKVIAVSTSLEPGSYKTDLTCVWESPTASSSPAGGCK